MPRYHEPYTLYSRKTKAGVKVYYYRAYTAEGERTHGYSTGKSTRAEASRYCNALIDSGELVPGPKPVKPASEVRRSRRPPTLKEWSVERHWWEWTGKEPACEYCKGELARSDPEKPAIQRRTADVGAMVLKTHLLPALGSYRMDQVTPMMCEELMASWHETLSAKTVNDYASYARTMFREAARLGVIPSNPWEAVKSYYAKANPKGILSIDEYKRLMAPDPLRERWPSDVYYAVHLLASVTGLRPGEVLALRAGDIHEDHITVRGSWSIKYGEGMQKTKRGTDELPIPRYVHAIVAPLASAAHGGYVFSFTAGKRPVTAGRSADALERALTEIGIDPEERKRRKLSPHSWRAFANTYFLGRGISTEKVQKITRHATDKMTEHYSQWRLEDFTDVAAAQAALVGELGK